MTSSIFLESFNASFDILGQKKNETFGTRRGVENNKIVLTSQIIIKSFWNLQNRVSGLILHPLGYLIFYLQPSLVIFHIGLWPWITMEPNIVHNYCRDVHAYNNLI